MTVTELPQFRYHPDPIASGSIVASGKKCRCCRQSKGYIYAGPVYAEEELDDALCPWCIASGDAHRKFDAVFVDSEAFPETAPEAAVKEITERTPGYSAWQGEQWPVCCGDATAFVMPAGLAELRMHYGEWEGSVLNYIIREMGISGSAALRLLDGLKKDAGPTLFLFQCTHCRRLKFFIDQA